jgi:hypothetical protein
MVRVQKIDPKKRLLVKDLKTPKPEPQAKKNNSGQSKCLQADVATPDKRKTDVYM